MSPSSVTVYLIPSLLDQEAVHTAPPYIIDAVKNCQVFFVENDRTARRYLKKIWNQIIIDNYGWVVIDESEELKSQFRQKLRETQNIGIISEAGCPGIADPGQALVAIAHEMNVQVKPLVGPSSVLLSLMASGMNGQQFQFVGYLPINAHERVETIRKLESESQKKKCTQIFIETPYRNNQLIESIVKNCKGTTKFCIAVDITGHDEWIKTKKISEWKREKLDFHKKPAIFLLLA